MASAEFLLSSGVLMSKYCMLHAARHVDLTAVQRVPQPTRDVLVTRDHSGEREFSGFGAAKNNEYADCFIDGDTIPEDTIKVCNVLFEPVLGINALGLQGHII